MLLPYLLHYHSYLLRRLGSIGIKIVITLNLRYWSQRGLALHRVVCSIGTAMGNFQYTPVCSGENFTPMRIPLAREGARPDNATRGKPVARIEIMPQTSGWKIKAEIPFLEPLPHGATEKYNAKAELAFAIVALADFLHYQTFPLLGNVTEHCTPKSAGQN